MAYKTAWVLKKTNDATWRCERLSYRPRVAVEIAVNIMRIPAFQRSSWWSSASVSSSSLLLLPPSLPTVQSSSSPSSCSCWHKNRPTVNCCSTKIAIKLFSSPVIDCQYYYNRRKTSTAVVRAVTSPSSLSSSMPAQQAVEEEEEKEEKPPSNVSSFLKFWCFQSPAAPAIIVPLWWRNVYKPIFCAWVGVLWDHHVCIMAISVQVSFCLLLPKLDAFVAFSIPQD